MSNHDVTESRIDALLDDIKLHVNTDMFKRHLHKCSRLKLEAWVDEDGLDLLHHAILERNFVVVGTFFALGYFKPPHEATTSWTYVHVAAVLGQRTIVSLLLQERPYDNKKVVLDWPLFHKAVAPRVDITKAAASIVPVEEKEKELTFLPLDLAARYGHVQCVKVILDFHIFHSQQGQGSSARRSSIALAGHLNMACILDSSFALRLLLTDNPEAGDVKNALDISLKMAKPECVDALLRFGVDTKPLFGGMNLFHVLFAYSKSFEESWFESYITVTSVLLRHGFDVNACRPSRTFPLYSLLRCLRISNMDKSAPYTIAGLLLLLQAGADPNFDEIIVEEAVRDKEHHTAFGRRPYASALHCLVDAAVNYMEEVTDTEHVCKFVYKCCELLLRHGADASYVGMYHGSSHGDDLDRQGNVLHALCDVTPQLGRVDSSLLLLLLRHGADPDACVNGRFPLTSYMDAICPAAEPGRSVAPSSFYSSTEAASQVNRGQRSQPPGNALQTGTGNRSMTHDVTTSSRQQSIAAAAPTTSSRAGGVASTSRTGETLHAGDHNDSELVIDTRRMSRMLGFMSRTSQLRCGDILRERLALSPFGVSSIRPPRNRSASDDVSGACLRRALLEVEKYTLAVPSLRRCCAMVVWRQCRRHVGNVYKLPIPMPLINLIIDCL